MFKLWKMVAAATLMASAAPASSAVLQFTLTGVDTASFLLDPSTLTIQTISQQPFLYALAVPGVYDGTPGTASISFFDSSLNGGFEIQIGNWFVAPEGPVLFQGTLANPIFVPNTFTFVDDYGVGPIHDQLVISDPSQTPAVPEPGSWILMLAGFAALGCVMHAEQSRKSELVRPL